MRHRRLRPLVLLLLTPWLAASARAQESDTAFAEQYALAAERGKVVATLLAGSAPWYEYTCRERLAARDFAGVRALLGPWVERYGRSAEVVETENRLALLSYEQDPGATFAFLGERLGLRFDDQPTAGAAASTLPTRLDPALLAREAWVRRARELHPRSLDGFNDSALTWLAERNLDEGDAHTLLARLARPDLPGLPERIVRDLHAKFGSQFGTLPLHAALRLEHLEECARLDPTLLQEPRFVAATLERMRPGADSSWFHDPAEHGAQLARLWTFVERLPALHNSLKAHVLYHYLQHDLAQGAPDKGRFLAYLRLPGRKRHLPAQAQRPDSREAVDPSLAFPTGLDPIRDDEGLVRACLEHFLAREESLDVYAEFLDASWLRSVLAETRLLAGDPDPARWYALLADPARAEELARRVEIGFPPTLRTLYAAEDPVVLEVDTKNVPTLLVKVFAIDAYRYLVEKQQPVDESIDLEGLVATFEQTVRYDDPPMRRVRRRFELPILAQAGTFVVEFVGNGVRSRAVIHKGFLRHVEETGAAGHLFSVFDEAGARLADASVWCGGREYGADATGEILVPFSGEGGQQTIVLRQGERASLARFEQGKEEYLLIARVHVDREALIAGARASLLVRPELLLADRPVALKLLTDPVLTLVSTDLDGLSTTQEVRGLTLSEERELVHAFSVPERASRLAVTLRGRVSDLAGKPTELASATTTFEVNGIDAVARTSSAQLLRTTAGYFVEVRGKDGEPKAGRPVPLALFARDFRDPLEVTLQTDAAGRIELGTLDGIDGVRVPVEDGTYSVPLQQSRCVLPDRLHGLAGTTLRLPYPGPATAPTREAFSLLASDHDAFSHLALADGLLELRDLEPGDYDLGLHELDVHIPVRVARGREDRGWVVGRERTLAASTTRPLGCKSLAIAGDQLEIALTNARASTRVCVVATRYLPPFELYDLLSEGGLPLRVLPVEPAESRYLAAQPLGDEVRYVLERRFAPKHPGNMLPRPSLLLNPWSPEEVLGGHYGTGVGSAFGSRRAGGGGRGGGAGGRGSEKSRMPAPHPGTYANLDYLPGPSITLADLVPDASGLVRVPVQSLGEGQLVHVLALDEEQAVSRILVRPEQPLRPRTRHLAAGLDAGEHAIELRRIEFVTAGGEAVVDSARVARTTTLDSLASVYRLLLSISADADLARFEFLVRWPGLTRAEKLDFYERFACHELHFFLYQKDPAFFAEVVRPLLAAKLHKTFLDEWLLGADLRASLQPWAFGRLNLIEKILLARRLEPAERAAVTRFVGEAHELLPPDRARLRRLFDLALANDALASAELHDEQAREGLERKKVSAIEEERTGIQKDESADEEPSAKGPEDAWFLGHGERLAADADRRAEVRRLYQPVDPTRALLEHDYWHRVPRADDSFAALVPASAFWRDFAAAPADRPFVSTAVAEASSSFLEMVFALAVLDLPFEAGANEWRNDGSRRILRAATPLLLVRKETAPVRTPTVAGTLLLGENFLRLDDRRIRENGVERDKFVEDEFLTDVPYLCQVVVTNPTSTARSPELLLQIPAGAVPLQRGFWTRGMAVGLGPFTTQALEYAFYFPAPGDFAHYPVHAADGETLAGAAAPRTLHVVDKPTRVDLRSFEHVSQLGSTAEVLGYLEQANLQELDLGRLAWRLREREFFTSLVALLRARHVYSHRVWSYGILNRDPQATREYLEHADTFVSTCGACLESPLLTIDPVRRALFEHVEFDPLVHARAHARGAASIERLDGIARQYRAFLDVLGYRPRLDARDWAEVTYHFLLQDRVDDALAAFARIDRVELAADLQHDYLSAYLCFYTGDLARARSLAEAHREHPVEHWRKRFLGVLSALDEIEGKTPSASGVPSQDQLAATEPALELAPDGRRLVLRYRNLTRCEVRYYPLDVELAFSTRPFASSDSGSAAFVQPSSRQDVELPAGRAELALDLPPEFRTANVLVEVRAGAIARKHAFYANALDVRYLEPYGQVLAADPRSGKPLGTVYVKCFAHLPDGTVRFHKDGYTDLRGRFDYASVSDDQDLGADRFAVLVLSDELGADLREVAPPAR